MIFGNKLLLIVVMAVFLTGCANTNWQIEKSQSVTPQSYSVYRSPTERSVGKLRKVLLVNVSLPTPEVCRREGNPDYPPPWITPSYLSEVKGYDVSDIHKLINGLTDTHNAAIRQLVDVAERVGDSGLVAAPTAVSQLLLSEFKFDALMLVESSWDCLKAVPEFRWGMAAMTLGVEECFPNPQYQRVRSYYRATLFEAVSGRPVWQSRVRNIFSRTDSVFDDKKLFSELEQAVPVLLTQ